MHLLTDEQTISFAFGHRTSGEGATSASDRQKNVSELIMYYLGSIRLNTFNVLPRLFFGAFCSEYWRRLWLPVHHTATATGKPNVGAKNNFKTDHQTGWYKSLNVRNKQDADAFSVEMDVEEFHLKRQPKNTPPSLQT